MHVGFLPVAGGDRSQGAYVGSTAGVVALIMLPWQPSPQTSSAASESLHPVTPSQLTQGGPGGLKRERFSPSFLLPPQQASIRYYT